MSNPGARVPLVSVVMPAFRTAGTLARAIGSVQAQTLRDWEMIAVDDGSGDGTGAELARLAATEPRVRVISLAENRGATAARNVAIAASTGRYVAFLDADDAWHPDKLARQIALMAATGTALSYTGFVRVAPGGAARRVRVPERLTYGRLLLGNAIGCLTAIYDADQVGRMAMPDSALRHDYALWLAILRPGRVARGLPEVLATYHRQDGSLSVRTGLLRGARATWDLFRRIEGLSAPRAAFCLAAHYVTRLWAMR